MRLKKQKKDESYDPAKCAKVKCKEPSTVIYDAGVGFDKSKGRVPLCDNHNEQLIKENQVEQAVGGTPPDVVQPVAAPPEPVQDSGIQAAMVAEAATADEVLQMARDFTVNDQSDLNFADEILGKHKVKLKWIKTEKEKATGPLFQGLEAVRDWFRPAEKFHKEAEEIWKDKIAEGALRLEQAAQAAVEAASQAHAQGDVDAVAQAMVAANTATVETPKRLTIAKKWAFHVVDPAAIPAQYLAPDMEKIQAVVDALGDAAGIPGIEVFRQDSVTQRRA